MASKYIQKFPIPDKFPEILHDLSKEILRYQPQNIIEFCALYFKCLQEGKELDYKNQGPNIPCDFKNVIPGQKTSERAVPEDKSNYDEAIEKAKKLNIKNIDNESENKPAEKPIVKAASKEENKEAPVNMKKIDSSTKVQNVKRAASGSKKMLKIEESGDPKEISKSFVSELMSKSYREEEIIN